MNQIRVKELQLMITKYEDMLIINIIYGGSMAGIAVNLIRSGNSDYAAITDLISYKTSSDIVMLLVDGEMRIEIRLETITDMIARNVANFE